MLRSSFINRMNISQNKPKLENKRLIDLCPTNTVVNEKGHLKIGSCDVVDLAQKYGTPLYIIDEETFRNNCLKYKDNLSEHYSDFIVLYAAKAFACTSIFKIAHEMKLGLDIVSGGEFNVALKAGFDNQIIYFHGNNKQYEEINHFVDKCKNGKIVCDNFNELEMLRNISKKRNKKLSILVRLTPGIECHTHEYIKTGHLDSKFGFDIEYYPKVLKFIKENEGNLSLIGLHAHIGSQIFEIKPYLDTIDILLEQFQFTKDKYNIELTELNIGGGIGISYTSQDDPINITNWAKAITQSIKENCKKLNLKLPTLICEPGRSLIANCGVTIYKAGSIKQVPNGRKYISVDGGMADNPRPITYQAEYSAILASKAGKNNEELVTIAGRYCETGDLLIEDIRLPKVETGDYIAILNTGAYNYSMSSNYNMVPRPACVLVNNGISDVIIERENYDDLIKNHIIPKRLITN